MATLIHDKFINDVQSGLAEDWMQYERWELWEHPRFGIAVTAFLGVDLLNVLGHWSGEDDEQFFTERWPQKVNRMNCICGKSLVAHYAYYPQRYNGMENSSLPVGENGPVPSKILARYRRLAGL